MKKTIRTLGFIAVILSLAFTACGGGDDGSGPGNGGGTTYAVTVTNGAGGGNYAQGATVTITANTPPTGQKFILWTTASADVTLADANSASTTFTMPGNAVTVTANFELIPTYAVTVTNGAGGGNYAQGATVTITANTPPIEQKFVNWTTASAGVTFTNANSASTTFTMPGNAVTVTANFETAPYAVGNTGPGGGIIFYHSPAGFTVEMVNPAENYTAHYLEVAPSSSGSRTWASFGYASTDIPGTGTAIGTGMKNTALILNVDANAPAAKVCKDLTLGGKTDWFLPSLGELNELYTQRNLTGIKMTIGTYWSSSQFNDDCAWFQFFSNGGQYDGYKYNQGRVRAIRAF